MVVLTRKDHTPSPRAPFAKLRLHLISNQGVLVNLTCKLTRNQQTVKCESVSAVFPNDSHVVYRQGAADMENDNRSNKINVY